MILESILSTAVHKQLQSALCGNLVSSNRPEVLLGFTNVEGVDDEVASILTGKRFSKALFGGVGCFNEPDVWQL